MLITLYGVNNIGKSTQAKLLVENLNKLGHKAIYLKYPIYDIEPSGTYINKILRSGNQQQISEQELQLWFTVNRFQFQPKLTQLLNEGYIVIAEDYTVTGLAWGSAKGAALSWLETVNEPLIKEDLAILIQGERTVQSIEEHHIHENDEGLVAKVSQILQDLAVSRNFKVVNRQENLLDTQKLILDIVKTSLS